MDHMHHYHPAESHVESLRVPCDNIRRVIFQRVQIADGVCTLTVELDLVSGKRWTEAVVQVSASTMSEWSRCALGQEIPLAQLTQQHFLEFTVMHLSASELLPPIMSQRPGEEGMPEPLPMFDPLYGARVLRRFSWRLSRFDWNLRAYAWAVVIVGTLIGLTLWLVRC